MSEEPLAAHLAARVAELGEQAERQKALATARLDAVEDVRTAEEARASAAARRMEAGEKVAAQSAAARFEDARRRLIDMTDGVAEGAQLIRRVVEAQRRRALAQRQDRESADVRAAVAELSSSIGSPVDDASDVTVLISELDRAIRARIAAVEAREQSRRRIREDLRDLSKRNDEYRELRTAVSDAKDAKKRLATAITQLERRREVVKSLREEAETSRVRIVRRVFNQSLNQIWRELFVRLAPEEPFVPAFRVPTGGVGRVAVVLETVHRDGKPGGTPGAMLSAGNLNTAALTLFLALHLSAEARLPSLILDDPVQSMDEVHVSQFAALLRTLTKTHGRRILIAVHEQALFEYLTLELSPAQPGDSLATVELTRLRDGASIAQQRFLTYEEDRALVAG